jgi:galactonate dehydratase
MLISDIRIHRVNLDFRNGVLLEIETDAGITGIAETVMKRKTNTAAASIEQLRPVLIGRDPTEIEDLWEKMYRDSFWVGGPMHSTAISVVDCALWDILAKSVNLPVYKLHGGPTRKTVPAYCHCPAGDSPEQFAQNVRSAIARGYQAVKTTLPLFYGVRNGSGMAYSGSGGHVPRSWKETEFLDASIFEAIREYFVAAREASGPSIGLAVDCHGRLGLKAAIRLCDALEDLKLMFIEEPTPPENADVLAAVQRESHTPIAAGERWATLHGVREFLDKQAVDILQCDLVNCGGITGMKKIAAMAEARYIGMAPHNPNGPLATVMNLHFASIIPNYFALETVGSEADMVLWKDLLDTQPVLKNGQLEVPDGPGYGVTLQQDGLRKHPYQARDGWR